MNQICQFYGKMICEKKKHGDAGPQCKCDERDNLVRKGICEGWRKKERKQIDYRDAPAS